MPSTPTSSVYDMRTIEAILTEMVVDTIGVEDEVRRPATKVLDSKTSSDNIPHTNLRSSSESRIRACPGLLMPASVQPLPNVTALEFLAKGS